MNTLALGEPTRKASLPPSVVAQEVKFGLIKP
jgi:hypothetical protein